MCLPVKILIHGPGHPGHSLVLPAPPIDCLALRVGRLGEFFCSLHQITPFSRISRVSSAEISIHTVALLERFQLLSSTYRPFRRVSTRVFSPPLVFPHSPLAALPPSSTTSDTLYLNYRALRFTNSYNLSILFLEERFFLLLVNHFVTYVPLLPCLLPIVLLTFDLNFPLNSFFPRCDWRPPPPRPVSFAFQPALKF